MTQSACCKCNISLGVMIDDEDGTTWCIACHPTAFHLGMKQHDILSKLEKNPNFKFTKTKAQRYE